MSTVLCTSVNVFMTITAREMVREAHERMARQHKYEVLVSAKTPEEAIDVASEAIAPGSVIVRSEAEDVSAEEGADTFRVSIWFTGGKGDDSAT
jgi:hypothetical protein